MSGHTALPATGLAERLALHGLVRIMRQPVPPHAETGTHCPTAIELYLKPGCPILVSIWLAEVPHLTFMVGYPSGQATLRLQDTTHALVSNFYASDTFSIIGLEWRPGRAATDETLAVTAETVHRLLARQPALAAFTDLDIARAFPLWVAPSDVQPERLDMRRLATVVNGEVWFRHHRKGGFKFD